MLLGTDVAQHWLTDPRYGPAYCQAQLLDMDRAVGVRNARAYLLAALQNNYAKWQPPAPRPDPHCSRCGGRGYVHDFANNKSDPCACIPRPASSQQPPAPQQAPDPNRRDTAALTAQVTADLTP